MQIYLPSDIDRLSTAASAAGAEPSASAGAASSAATSAAESAAACLGGKRRYQKLALDVVAVVHVVDRPHIVQR